MVVGQLFLSSRVYLETDFSSFSTRSANCSPAIVLVFVDSGNFVFDEIKIPWEEISPSFPISEPVFLSSMER